MVLKMSSKERREDKENSLVFRRHRWRVFFTLYVRVGIPGTIPVPLKLAQSWYDVTSE
jgi:hypothetical protein